MGHIMMKLPFSNHYMNNRLPHKAKVIFVNFQSSMGRVATGLIYVVQTCSCGERMQL